MLAFIPRCGLGWRAGPTCRLRSKHRLVLMTSLAGRISSSHRTLRAINWWKVSTGIRNQNLLHKTKEKCVLHCKSMCCGFFVFSFFQFSFLFLYYKVFFIFKSFLFLFLCCCHCFVIFYIPLLFTIVSLWDPWYHLLAHLFPHLLISPAALTQ